MLIIQSEKSQEYSSSEQHNIKVCVCFYYQQPCNLHHINTWNTYCSTRWRMNPCVTDQCYIDQWHYSSYSISVVEWCTEKVNLVPQDQTAEWSADIQARKSPAGVFIRWSGERRSAAEACRRWGRGRAWGQPAPPARWCTSWTFSRWGRWRSSLGWRTS